MNLMIRLSAAEARAWRDLPWWNAWLESRPASWVAELKWLPSGELWIELVGTSDSLEGVTVWLNDLAWNLENPTTAGTRTARMHL